MATASRKRGGIEFDLRTDPPLKEFQYRVSRFTRGVSDMTSLMRAFGELFRRHMGEQFETEGRASGTAWAANEPSYAAWKAAAFHSHKVGVLTGALRSSMTGGGGYSETVTKKSGSFGMSAHSKAAAYGAYFAYVRPVLRVPARWGRQYQKVTHTWLVAEERASMGMGGSDTARQVRLGGVLGDVRNADLR